MGGKEGADIGASGDGTQKKVLLDVLVDEVKALRLEGRTGRVDGVKVLEVMILVGLVVGILNGLDVFCAGSKGGDVLLFDQVPEGRWTRLEGGSIKEDDGGSEGKARDEPVPHHPSSGSVLKEDVGGGKVAMKDVFLLVLEKHASCRVNDALGLSCCSGGEEDVEGVVEGKRFKVDGFLVLWWEARRSGYRECLSGGGKEFGPSGALVDRGSFTGLGRDEWDEDDLLDHVEALEDLVELLNMIMRTPVVDDGIDREEKLGLDLGESVEYALCMK